jgi:hypothetical protein
MRIADPSVGDERGYFRASIHVMAVLREEMRRFDMLDDDWQPGITRRRPSAISTHKLTYNGGQLVSAEEAAEALRAYERSPHRGFAGSFESTDDDPMCNSLAALAAGIPELGFVPGYKREFVHFDSGVAPWLRSTTDDEQREVLEDKWHAWLFYLQLAAAHGGFYVC